MQRPAAILCAAVIAAALAPLAAWAATGERVTTGRFVHDGRVWRQQVETCTWKRGRSTCHVTYRLPIGGKAAKAVAAHGRHAAARPERRETAHHAAAARHAAPRHAAARPEKPRRGAARHARHEARTATPPGKHYRHHATTCRVTRHERVCTTREW